MERRRRLRLTRSSESLGEGTFWAIVGVEFIQIDWSEKGLDWPRPVGGADVKNKVPYRSKE